MQPYRLKLDLQLFNQEKTEPATPKKRSEAREKGQVAASQEIPAAFILLFVFLSFLALGGYYKERLYRIFGDTFESGLLIELTGDSVMLLLSKWMAEAALLLAPIFAIALIVGVMGNYFQFGFLFTAKPLQPSLNNINPLNGAKNLFSSRSLVEFAKSLIKLLVVGYMVYSTLWSERETIVTLDHSTDTVMDKTTSQR